MVWVQGPFQISSSGGVKAPSRALLSLFVSRIQKEQLLVLTRLISGSKSIINKYTLQKLNQIQGMICIENPTLKAL